MATSKSTGGKGVIHRNSGNGQFVTKNYVKQHPRTTETETIPKRKAK